jgi:hypothetical protein
MVKLLMRDVIFLGSNDTDSEVMYARRSMSHFS